jgi:hypothetical protein
MGVIMQVEMNSLFLPYGSLSGMQQAPSVRYLMLSLLVNSPIILEETNPLPSCYPVVFGSFCPVIRPKPSGIIRIEAALAPFSGLSKATPPLYIIENAPAAFRSLPGELFWSIFFKLNDHILHAIL